MTVPMPDQHEAGQPYPDPAAVRDGATRWVCRCATPSSPPTARRREPTSLRLRPEFAVHVTTDITELNDDQLDELVERFIEYAGVPSMLGGRLSLQLTISDAESLEDAAVIAATAVRRNLPVPGQAVAVEVVTAAEFARGFAHTRPTGDLVVPTSEAAELLGVKRQRVLQLAKTYAGEFPEPVRLGSRGLFWSRTALSRFASTRKRSSGPKGKTSTARDQRHSGISNRPSRHARTSRP